MITTNKWDTSIYKKKLQFLARLNVTLTTDCNPKNNMEQALKLLGQHYNCDRIHILKIAPDMTFSILHEWCNCSAPALKEKMSRQKCFFEHTLEEQLNRDSFIHLDRNEIRNTELLSFLEKYSVFHMHVLPLFTQKLFSFLSFHFCHPEHAWCEEEIHYATIVASVIAANLEKNLLLCSLRRRRQQQINEPASHWQSNPK